MLFWVLELAPKRFLHAEDTCFSIHRKTLSPSFTFKYGSISLNAKIWFKSRGTNVQVKPQKTTRFHPAELEHNFFQKKHGQRRRRGSKEVVILFFKLFILWKPSASVKANANLKVENSKQIHTSPWPPLIPPNIFIGNLTSVLCYKFHRCGETNSKKSQKLNNPGNSTAAKPWFSGHGRPHPLSYETLSVHSQIPMNVDMSSDFQKHINLLVALVDSSVNEHLHLCMCRGICLLLQ